MENKQVAQTETKYMEPVSLARRGFLQKCALLTGAFLTGTLRLDQKLANASTSIKHYCCHLVKPKADCVLSECKSQFYWVCSYQDTEGPLLIRCVECFDIEISSEGKREVEQSWSEIENHYEHLRCSKAVHPEDHDALVF